eukprot:1633664-Rhodomonas_salina.1
MVCCDLVERGWSPSELHIVALEVHCCFDDLKPCIGHETPASDPGMLIKPMIRPNESGLNLVTPGATTTESFRGLSLRLSELEHSQPEAAVPSSAGLSERELA